MIDKENAHGRGRPRTFDRDEALEKAMILFWRHGYDGTSIGDLTGDMGIAAPSLYAAFGSKLDLYREALALYVDTLGRIGVETLAAAPSAKEGVAEVLRQAAIAFTREGLPAGCMVGVGSLRCAEGNAIAEEATMSLRQRSYQAVKARLEQARAEGEFATSTDVIALSDMFSAIVEGMSVLAHDGVPRDRLIRMANAAMAMWPN